MNIIIAGIQPTKTKNVNPIPNIIINNKPPCLLESSNLGIGIDCGTLTEEYSTEYNVTDPNNTEIKESSASIIDLALGRCEGLPFWLFVIFELPIIVGLLYIIRGFIGVT